MRLSAEVLDHIKKWYAKCEEADCMPENGLTIGRLLDTIEALQQENEQLQAQVTRMREALRKAREAIKTAWSDGSANAAMDKASEALAAIDKVIGGEEDV